MYKIDVSVIIPLYNRIDLIADTIHSIQSQTYPHWEAIVIDDGSTDGSIEVVEKIAREDARVKLLNRNRNPKGAPVCRNIGLRHALGEYVIYLDSDDLLAPFCLERRLSHMRANPEVDFIVFPMLLFKDNPGDKDLLWNIDIAGEDDLARFLRLDALWQTSCPIYKRVSMVRIGGFDETLPFLQDYEIHVRILCSDLKYIKKLDVEPDCFLRRHKNESISQKGFNSKKSFLAKELVYKKILNSILARHHTQYHLYVSALFFTLSKKWLQKYHDLNKSLACWANTKEILETDLYDAGIGYLHQLSRYYNKKEVSFLVEIHKTEKLLPLVFSNHNHRLNLVSQSTYSKYKNHPPFFSIIIPVNSQVKNLPFLLEQVLHQTYSDYEVIVLNNGMTDISKECIEKYDLQDERIQTVNSQLFNEDINEQLDKAINNAKGEYIWIVESPCFVDNNFLTDIIGYLMSYPNIGLIYCLPEATINLGNWNNHSMYKDETKWSAGFYKNGSGVIKNLLLTNTVFPAANTVVFNKTVYKSARITVKSAEINTIWVIYSYMLLYADMLFVSKLLSKKSWLLDHDKKEQVTHTTGINSKELSKLVLTINGHPLLKLANKKLVIRALVDIWGDMYKIGSIPSKFNFFIYRMLAKADHSTQYLVLSYLLKKFIRNYIPFHLFHKSASR